MVMLKCHSENFSQTAYLKFFPSPFAPTQQPNLSATFHFMTEYDVIYIYLQTVYSVPLTS